MPSERYKSKKYESVPKPSTNTGTSAYGPGAYDDHPPLPVTPDFRDDTRAAEFGGLRSWYRTRNWPDRIDHAALEKIRRDFMFPRVTSK